MSLAGIAGQLMCVENDIFNYPKPVSLIEYLINFIADENDVVMDFFAGSGTTAEAVYSWCNKHNKKIRYVLVQLDEDLEQTLKNSKARSIVQNGIDYLNLHNKPLYLTELTKIRIQKAIDKYKQTGGGFLDLGFRVLKVDSSNFNENLARTPKGTIQENLLNYAVDNIKPDRIPEDLLFQILLNLGLDLALPIRSEKLDHCLIFTVAVDHEDLIACFDSDLTKSIFESLAKRNPEWAVFRDSSFATDADKINAKQIFHQYSPQTNFQTL